jgi:hypothetical protein
VRGRLARGSSAISINDPELQAANPVADDFETAASKIKGLQISAAGIKLVT